MICALEAPPPEASAQRLKQRLLGRKVQEVHDDWTGVARLKDLSCFYEMTYPQVSLCGCGWIKTPVHRLSVAFIGKHRGLSVCRPPSDRLPWAMARLLPHHSITAVDSWRRMPV